MIREILLTLQIAAICATVQVFPNLALAEFRRAVPGFEFDFPRSHGSHPEFRTEWWYYTANVTSDTGHQFGVNLTVFRSAQAPPGAGLSDRSRLAADQIFIGHFAITDITNQTHFSTETIGREGLGQAFASTERLDIAINGWSITMDENEVMRLRADYRGDSIDLTLTPLKPFVIHGEGGAHKKAADPGQASHYISFTRLEAVGTVVSNGRTHRVTGLGWMDHEFGSDWLSPEEIGWDWFAIQLDNGKELMAYQLRRADGTFNPYSTGTIIYEDGRAESIPSTRFSIETTAHWTSPRTNATYPAGWVIRIPEKDLELTVTPRKADQEMMTDRFTGAVYWEGSVSITGIMSGEPVSGIGYVELVGYAEEFGLLTFSN